MFGMGGRWKVKFNRANNNSRTRPRIAPIQTARAVKSYARRRMLSACTSRCRGDNETTCGRRDCQFIS
jgi:hypothetical protein